MYEIKSMLADFTEKELAVGAERFAAGLSVLEKAEPEKSEDQDSPGSRLMHLYASVRDEERDRYPSDTEAVLDEEYGELVRTSCNCRSFRQDLFGCPHIVSAILCYLEKRDGRGALIASPLNDILEKHTGIKGPFRKGILRNTEPILMRYLQEKKQEELSLMQYGGKKAGSFRVICITQYESNQTELYIELKMGEKRLYVVKNLREMLSAYEGLEVMSFGKSLEVQLSPELFDEQGRNVMDFLLHIYQEEKLSRNTASFMANGSGDARYMRLYGDRLDRFMETVAVNGLYIGNEKNRCVFSPEESRLPVVLEKQEFGALMRMEETSVFARSVNWIYLLSGEKLYRIPAGNENSGLVLSSLISKPELYISERELPSVCRDLLPAISPMTSLQFKDMDPKDYLPPKPRFELYLDYPQEGLISCQSYAFYPYRPAEGDLPVQEDSAEILDENGDVIFSGAKVSESADQLPRQSSETETPVTGGRQRGSRFLLYALRDLEENRDFTAERITGEAIRSYFKAFDEQTATLFFDGDEKEIFEFLNDRLPALEKIGTVYISDNLKKLRIRPLSAASVGVSLSGGLLEMSVHSDVFSSEELAEILSSYHRKKRYHRLKSGMFVSFGKGQEDVWTALSEAMRYAGKDQEHIRIPMFRAMYLDDLLREKSEIDYTKSRDYRALLRSMKSAEDAEFEVPAFLEPVLRNYQKEGFRWLKTLKANGFGGILADDMGLGKTLQVLTFLLSEKEDGKGGDALRTLIVTPASLVYNWKKEIEQYTPQLVPAVISGNAQERKLRIARALEETAEVWITSYDLLKRDVELYDGISFANEIVDEAQYIKNQMTIASKSVRLVNSGFRAALTGTPIENKLSELWSIFDYLMPGFLYDYSRFRTELELPIVSEQDEDAMDRIRRMVHPFVLRRLKKDVLKELPEKTEEAVTVELTGEQRRLYEAHEERLKLFLEKQSEEEFAQNRIAILAELTKLRQLCCGPELLFENYEGPNAKLEACMELVHQALDGGHKLLLFSQFTSMLDLICERLTREELDYYRIDGSVKKEERMKMVDAFQEEGNPVMVFCISLKAGGTGLNLTAADIVIHYDPWWNLAAQNQATDRVHRIGQVNPVTVYQLIAERTIEERIRDLQESKYQLAEEVLNGGEIGSIRVDRDEILELLKE